MTSAQILILIKFLLNKGITLQSFSWSHTDQQLHLQFFDEGSNNRQHKSFNGLGHVRDWED